jgi:phosphate transport system substrate-binding protein
MPRNSPVPRHAFITTIFLSLLLLGCSTDSDSLSLDASETIVNKGSDTIVNLALAWAEAYKGVEPTVDISVTGGGSGTGIAALINGTVDLANASRQIKPEEREEAEANGIQPIQFVIARDAIAIIVNPNNPIDELSIDQLSDIYSGKINNWSELGGEDRPIVRLSRESNSGTHVYFLEHVLRRGDKQDSSLFSPDTLLLPSSEGITVEVRENPNAIGYDGLGYVTDDVKVVAVAVDPSGPFVLPSIQSVNEAAYPISRDLYMYTAGEPSGSIFNYLEWIMQAMAQTIVSDLGFVPATP